jgi:hypothetical protein
LKQGNLKTEGIVDDYYYKYVHIEKWQFTKNYKNELEFRRNVQLINGEYMGARDLKDCILFYDHVIRNNSLDEVKPRKGKDIIKLVSERQALIDSLKDLECSNCEKLVYHMTQ